MGAGKGLILRRLTAFMDSCDGGEWCGALRQLLRGTAPTPREWLTGLPGARFEPDSPEEMPSGQFSWGGEVLCVYLGPAACYVCVPTIKYSWLLTPLLRGSG